MKKKLFAILLSLTMVVTMMPAMAFAAYEDESSETIDKLLSQIDATNEESDSIDEDLQFGIEDSVANRLKPKF